MLLMPARTLTPCILWSSADILIVLNLKQVLGIHWAQFQWLARHIEG